MDEPAGHRAVGNLAHANARCGTTRRADRVRATLVTSIESPTNGDRLSRQKGKFLEEPVGHLERDRRRVGAQLVDSGDREAPELAASGRGRPAGRTLRSPLDTRTVRRMMCSDTAHGRLSHRIRTAALCRARRTEGRAPLAPIA